MGIVRLMTSFLSFAKFFWGNILKTVLYLLYLTGILIYKISKWISGVLTFIVRIIKRSLLVYMLDFL